MRKFFSIITLVLWVIFLAISINFEVSTSFLASLFFTDSVTATSLKDVYEDAQSQNDKIKILIVPGHDDESWGTDYRGVKEADLTVKLGEELFSVFDRNELFEPVLARTKSGYNPILTNYFDQEREEIEEFIRMQKEIMSQYLAEGKIKSNVIIQHNKAQPSVVQKLYGINKWANENGMDIIIHVHFNDYPRSNRSAPGRFSGFSMYIPERQYSNAKGSRAVAESVFSSLSAKYPVSNLPLEDEGIIEDQRLIGIGSFNTLDGAGMYIEYSYIYEPILQNGRSEVTMADMAETTYLGVMDFFEDKEAEIEIKKERKEIQNSAPTPKEEFRFINPIIKIELPTISSNSTPTKIINLNAAAIYNRVINSVGSFEGF